MKTHNPQTGFTLIELMIATTIFSIVLTVILASFLQIGRMFYKGVSTNNTNESTRTLVDDISNDVRLADGATDAVRIGTVGDKYYFCIGTHRYTYVLKQPVTATNITNLNPQSMSAGVVRDTPASCDATTAAGSDKQQLLGPNMQLNALEFKCAATGCTIHAHVIYYGADKTVFASPNHPSYTPAQAINEPDARCSGNLLSTQFCSMADISTNVTLKF